MSHATRTLSADRRPAPAGCRPSLAARLALSAAALSALTVASPGLGLVAPAAAQQVTEEPSAQPSEELLDLVDDFYHTATLANYPAARAYGQQVLDTAEEPEAVLEAFQQVYDRRPDPLVGLDEQLIRFQGIPEIAEVSGAVVDLVNEGRQARATRLSFLQSQVERLGNGGIAYGNAIENLRSSGEYATPVLLSNLFDPNRQELQNPIRRALVDLGLPMVSPLLAALNAEDPQVKAEVMQALGELGYSEAIPYVLEQVETNQGQLVQQVGTQALGRLGYAGGSTAASEYYTVAESFWLNRSPIQPDSGFEGANLWRWDQGSLAATTVPAEIFNELMAMRAAGNTLALSQGANAAPQQVQDDALSLWLASNYRREIELPEGATDNSRPDSDATAGYYGTQAGVKYLQQVIERAANERTLPPESRYDSAAVALAAVQSMQDVVGESTLEAGATPLTRAMQFPDRRVAMEAALALAQALPTKAVEGGENVVPLLADALSQTGEPTVLLVMDNGDERNAANEALTEAGYRVQDATSVQDVVAKADVLAGVDVLVIDGKLSNPRAILEAARGTPKLRSSAKLFLVETASSEFGRLSESDPTAAITTARASQALVDAIEKARVDAGGLPLDEEGATALATRAADLLMDIGLDSSVYSLETARQPLLASLDDERPEIRQMATKIVAQLSGAEPQQALLSLGDDASAPDEVRVSAFDGLASSAKRYGNLLGQAEVDTLLTAAAETESPEVRAAAAKAVGALSLPVDQARRLIIESTRTADVP